MKIYIVGDPCAGKSTFLDNFSDKRFEIFEEEGYLKIPTLLEANKFFSYLWFYLYYYNRDKSIKTEKTLLLKEDFMKIMRCWRPVFRLAKLMLNKKR